MGAGGSVPRVPLDNWLLPHLLTSPPLTFLHFTFKVLHFFPHPFFFFLFTPSSDLQYLLLYFFLSLYWFYIVFRSSCAKLNPSIQPYLCMMLFSIHVMDRYFALRMNGSFFFQNRTYAIRGNLQDFFFSLHTVFREYFSSYRAMFLTTSPFPSFSAYTILFVCTRCFVFDICMLLSLCPWPWLFLNIMIYIPSVWNGSELHSVKISDTDAALDLLHFGTMHQIYTLMRITNITITTFIYIYIYSLHMWNRATENVPSHFCPFFWTFISLSLHRITISIIKSIIWNVCSCFNTSSGRPLNVSTTPTLYIQSTVHVFFFSHSHIHLVILSHLLD